MKNIVKRVLEIAEKEVGVREDPGNRGKRVSEYQAADTLPGGGYAWCASFVAWCLKQAADNIPYCYSASCDVVLTWGTQHGVKHEKPEPGDIFLLMAKNSKSDAIHTGFVTSVNGPAFGTIEGNTSIDGSREGVGVFARTRTNSSRYVFIRWHDLYSGDSPDAPAPYKVFIGQREVDSVMVGAACFVAVREWGEALGFDVEWNAEDQLVLFDGEEVPTQIRRVEGKGFAWIRDLASFSGLKLDVKQNPKEIRVVK